MIRIGTSATADTRTCDFRMVSRDTLRASSEQHIGDVRKAMHYFAQMILHAGVSHDADKLTDLDNFHADFLTGFAQTGWWDRHRAKNRHHLEHADGVPDDVNLIDVLEFVADCVMAGMARSGSVRPLNIAPETLARAFENTWRMLAATVEVVRLAPSEGTGREA